jgi:hypothetical protein
MRLLGRANALWESREKNMSYNHKQAKARKKRQKWEDHTERRLRDNFDVYSNDINKSYEGLLDESRVGKDKETTTEDQLEPGRGGTRHAVTEKLMDTEDASFGNVMRKAVETGELPPLEAQRLADAPVEKDKYEAANKKPKKDPSKE